MLCNGYSASHPYVELLKGLVAADQTKAMV